MVKVPSRRLSKIILLIITLVFSFGLLVSAGPSSVDDVLDRAPARDVYPDSDAVVMLDKGVAKINQDAGKSLTVTKRIKVFNKEGRQKFGEVKIPYLVQSGKPKINWIRTITPEGKVVKPEKDDIRDVTPARLQQYPMYSDLKNRVVSMPGLTNGAIIDYSYTISPKRFFLKEDFSSSWLFRSKQPIMKSYFEVSFPEDMEVEWTSFGAEADPTVREEEGRKSFIWERSDLKKITEEPAMPPITRISDRVLVSSIESWEYYAREFWKLAEGRAKPSDAIRKKVRELTEGLKGKDGKIRALYNYVATKIRYVAIELGRGKYQPHKASEVFKNKYGDCKDKATLLISMLKVAGVQAHPVLILAGLNAKTDFQAPPPGKGLNHAIVAVERQDGLQLLDPTCDTCPYGYLPDTDRGKKVLAIVPRDGGVKKVLESEPFEPSRSSIKVDQEIEIDKEGNLKTSVEISHSGYYSYSLKSWMESYSNQRQKQLYRGLLSQLESGAVLEEFSHSNLEEINERLTLNLTYQKKGYADQLGDSLLFQTPPSLRIPLDRNYDQYVSLPVEERKYPLQMVPATVVDEITIAFPGGREIVKPEGVSVDTEWASYVSSYTLAEGGKLSLTRKFVKKKSLLPVDGYGEFKRLVNQMREDQQSKFQIKG